MPKLLIVSMTFCLAFAACTRNDQRPAEQDTAMRVAQENEYPGIVLRLMDGQEIQAKQLSGNNVFVLFQPDCDHCQHEAVSIEQRLEDFNNYTLYFISSAPTEDIVAFAENFGLNQKSNVKFAWTATQGVLDNYGPIQTPSIYIYSDGRLKKYFNGQTDIETILSAL